MPRSISTPRTVLEPVAIPLTQAPAVYGLSRSRIYRAAAAGKVKLMKAGRATLVDAESMRAFLASLPTLTPRSGP